MHVSIRTYPVRYEPETILDSSSEHIVRGTEYFSKFTTGAKIQLPSKQLYRTVVTELTAGGIYAERAFLHVEGETEMFPIWSKFYNQETAPVIVFRDAITTLVGEWSLKDFKSTRFFGEELLGKTLFDLSCLCSMEAEALWDEMCILSGIAGSWMNNNDQLPHGLILEGKSKNPLWSGEYLNPAVKEFYRRQAEQAFNGARSLADLCGSDRPFNTHYLEDEIRKRTQPDLGEDYFDLYAGSSGVDYDNLTVKSYEAPEMKRDDVRRYLGMYRPDRTVVLDNFVKMDDHKTVVEYEPGLLALCTVLHEIPAFEYSFIYKLPRRENDRQQPQSIKWLACIKPSQSSMPSDQDVMSHLSDALILWSPDIYEIRVSKNSDSEVLLAIRTMNSGDHLMYLDLTIAALLSNNLTYKQ